MTVQLSNLLDPTKPNCIWAVDPPRENTRYGQNYPFIEIEMQGQKYVVQVADGAKLGPGKEGLWISLYCQHCDKWLAWHPMPKPTESISRSCNPNRRPRSEMLARAQATDTPSKSCAENAINRAELAHAHLLDALDAASQKCQDLPNGDGLAKAVQAARNNFTRTAVIPDFKDLRRRAVALTIKEGQQEAADGRPDSA